MSPKGGLKELYMMFEIWGCTPHVAPHQAFGYHIKFALIGRVGVITDHVERANGSRAIPPYFVPLRLIIPSQGVPAHTMSKTVQQDANYIFTVTET